MAKIKGIDFVLKINNKTVAGRKGASMSVSSDTIETTTAESNGWKEKDYGFKEWSISTDGLLVVNDLGFDAVEEALIDGTILDIEVIRDKKKFTGKCLVTSLESDCPFDDMVSYSISLEGTGELVKALAV